MAAPSKKAFELFVSKIPWTVAGSKFMKLFEWSLIHSDRQLCVFGDSLLGLHVAARRTQPRHHLLANTKPLHVRRR